MNVRRLFLHRLHEDQVHDLDDRRVFGICRQPVEIDLFVLLRLNFDVVGRCRFLRDLLQHLGHLRAAVMHAGQGIGHRSFGGDHRDDIELHPALHVIHREDVRRIRHRHKQLPVQPRDRHQLVCLRQLARHQRHDFFRHPKLREIDQRRVEATPHAHRHVLVRDELFVRQNFQQPAALFLLQPDRFLELARQEEAVLDQDIGDAFRE